MRQFLESKPEKFSLNFSLAAVVMVENEQTLDGKGYLKNNGAEKYMSRIFEVSLVYACESMTVSTLIRFFLSCQLKKLPPKGK